MTGCRGSLRVAAATLCLGIAAAQEHAAETLSGSRPNILFLCSDDHAAPAISAYGGGLAATPQIDRLAQGGLLFRAAFCGNAICGPSRASMLTGLHSHANGFQRNGNTFDGAQVTLPKLLQQAGYQTAIVGKWHLASTPTGFDHWIVLPDQGQYYNPDFLTAQGRVRKEGHATDITTDLAIEWLDRQRDPERPFLLMCQHKAPHRPWLPAPADLSLFADVVIPAPATLFDDHVGRVEAARHTEMQIDQHLYLHGDLVLTPPDDRPLEGIDAAWHTMLQRMTEAQRATFLSAYAAENAAFWRQPPTGRALVQWKYQRYLKNYLRCVGGVDRSVGRLLDWLHRHPELERNTLVVYTSDQGFFLGEHGWYDKRWMYDESLRLPLLVAWPGRIEGPREVAQLVQNIDFAPTFLDLAGAPVPAAMHGSSLVPLLEGRTPSTWRDAIYYHFYESQAVHMVPAHFGVRTESHKLIRYYEPQWNAWELFDLRRDPDELHSVADDPAYAETRRALEQRLRDLRRQFGDSTGDLGDGAFPLTAGLARVATIDGGFRVWANASGGYALQTGERAGTTELSATLRPLRGRPQQNGFVLASGGDPRADLVRAGIAFGRRRLCIVGPGNLDERAGVDIDWDGASAVAVRVTLDLEGHRIAVQALGRSVEATLPPAWTRLVAWGYGASNAETEFTALGVK